jgi:hypothetical protein
MCLSALGTGFYQSLVTGQVSAIVEHTYPLFLMKHFTRIRGQVETAGSSENLVLSCSAGFSDLLFRVPWVLRIGQINVTKVFNDR